MWCPNCRADVAAEATADNRSLRCATCSTQLMASRQPPHADTTQHAHELLRRWTSEEMLDSFGPRPYRTRTDSSAEQPAAPAAQSASPADVKVRFDRPHSGVPHQADAHRDGGGSAGGRRIQPSGPHSPAWARVDAAHPSVERDPHFDVQAAIAESMHRPTNWASFFGHLLAYGGVLAMTIGASLVVWGYFGNQSNYAPTGWLLTTAGQMLLFLGMITLVSGGMEETTHEVARRIDTLGEKIVRIEQASRDHALRGPNFPPQALDAGAVAFGTVEQAS